ncbi:hypothetical protein PsorP6_004642 [Peronosclerospora sorghi]|uniref:Uncharacterized protein n=1 Tax=Peronosclerospora sorghi TaxID=230839 RepID=A0ACC0VPS3_9STRA|nr:hypothetical protein PsorP6_004642 [Peronosclerospora sorghi]
MMNTTESSLTTRCSVCDGIYHTSCLFKLENAKKIEQLKLQGHFTCIKCRFKMKKNSGEEVRVVEEDILPVMVPALAFPYIKKSRIAGETKALPVFSQKSTENGNIDESIMDHSYINKWKVFSTSVEVCTTCRQVQIALEETLMCSKCHNARLHRRCVEPKQERKKGIKRRRTNGRTSRKRCRASSAASLSWCVPCLVENSRPVEHFSGGSIETRTIAMLVNVQSIEKDKDIRWWKECSVCLKRFCFQDFCDPKETDANVKTECACDEGEEKWCCGHCAPFTRSIAAHDLVTMLICDGCEGEFDMAVVEPHLAEAPEGEWFCPHCCLITAPVSANAANLPEYVTVLICDRCEGEFDMARMHPPLQSIPEGNWFCGTCVAEINRSANISNADKSTAPCAPMMLFHCDWCGNDYDMNLLNPPLSEIPSGKWCCPSCTSTNFPSKGKVGKSKRRRVSKQQSGAPAQFASILGNDGVVTVLLCDGCNHEFNPLTLHPPLFSLPKSEWFCPACCSARSTALAAVQTCVGCDTKFNVSRKAVDQVYDPRGMMDGVMLCEACRNLQIGYTRRRLVPTISISDESNASFKATIDRKRRQKDGGTSDPLGNSKKPKTSLSGPPVTDSDPAGVEPIDHGVIDSSKTPRVLIPKPIALMARSSGQHLALNETKSTSDWSSTTPTVLFADSTHDYPIECVDDFEDSPIFIICDICCGEFKMLDVIGTNDADAVPARPWFCKTCLRALKRSRKKRPRFSKQMVAEMQIHGHLLRATSAKDSDLHAMFRRGNPPKSLDERREMYELVGKSVGVYLEWDKHWCMGRVMAFHATHPSMHHTIRFDDGVVASLPLYAFALVIGTRTMLYVKVPALQNRWWPAQILRLNSLAWNLLMPVHREQVRAREHFRFVRIFTYDDRHMSCWVPKYLCRSLKRFVPPSSLDSTPTKMVDAAEDAFSKSVQKAQREIEFEIECLDSVFQALLAGFRRLLATTEYQAPHEEVKNDRQKLRHADFDNHCTQFAEAMVGKFVTVTLAGECGLSPGKFLVNEFDAATKRHVISPSTDTGGASGTCKATVDLLEATDGIVYHFEDASVLSEVAIVLELSGSDLGRDIPGEFPSKELLEKAIIQETEGLQNSVDLVAATRKRDDKDASYTCSYCLLAPDENQGECDLHDTKRDRKLEDLTVCIKCSRRFHTSCCDPPHAPISLVNSEDGTALTTDLKIPYVCGDCTACSGCGRQSDPNLSVCDERRPPNDPMRRTGDDWKSRWYQWRLPLETAALCTKCIPYYKANRFCGVCYRVLDNDQSTVRVDLLACSTCHHWIHADCEPDPHPAFRALESPSAFTLDVITEVSKEQSLYDPRASDNLKELTPAASSCREGEQEEFKMSPSSKTPGSKDDGIVKTAKQVDEDFARNLRFEAEYDPKAMHNYECLTCRKVRMLHILHRLGAEDKLDLFKEPVTETIAPTYFDIIKSPMDLSTMRQKILDGIYTHVNFRTFRDDFELMCLNAVTFNSKERDFLVWREAWRFYGQGQRILRQTAPKARMKQRGGPYYDALLVAAKRQLPNNSALAGKPQSSVNPVEINGDGGDNEEDEELEEDEDVENGSDAGSDALSRGNGTPDNTSTTPAGLARAVAVETLSVDDSDLRSDVVEPTKKPQESDSASDIAHSSAATSTMSVVTPSLPAYCSVTKDGSDFQTKLRVSYASRVPFFQLALTRPSAHEFCWLDVCAICGSAGVETDLIFCVDCGEGFHSFCVPGMNSTRVEYSEQMRAYWRCFNCKICEICGRPGAGCEGDRRIARVATAGSMDVSLPDTKVETDMTNELSVVEPLVLCAHCDRGYHGSCLVPSIRLPRTSDKSSTAPSIYCSSCVCCTSCSDSQGDSVESVDSGELKRDKLESLERTYSYEQTKCLRCHNRTKREAQTQQNRIRLLTEVWTADALNTKRDAEKCPLCRRKWDADLEELMQCDACERWVHPPCDALLKAEPKRYHTLVSDPSAVYVCAACRPLEREHLTGLTSDGERWRCQVLVAEIQRKRLQCDASWKETQTQLQQFEHWKRLADHMPVYLHVLHLGNECLRHLAYRSLNFQSDWYRLTKLEELKASGVVIPEWLLRKANRYLRFKRYARGPRLATRRRERTMAYYHSIQAIGLKTPEDASATCAIVSEAASSAALLACVHLLYGWRPLPEVVIHLLSSDEQGSEGRKLDESLLKRLRTDERVESDEVALTLKLKEEIVTINKQYDRQVAKELDGRKMPIETKVDVTPATANAPASTVITCKAAPSSGPERNSDVSPTMVQSKNEDRNDTVAPASNRYITQTLLVSSRGGQGLSVHMTTAPPLRGWLTTIDGDEVGSLRNATALEEDTRFCALCFLIGDNTACGRLLYTEADTWIHVNCILWSREVYEDSSGVLQRCSKAKYQSRLVRCDACGLVGATLGCCISRCTSRFHFPCAVDAGVAFLASGESCCPLKAHRDLVARRLNATDGMSLASVPGAAEARWNVLVQSALEDEDVNVIDAVSGGEDEACTCVDTMQRENRDVATIDDDKNRVLDISHSDNTTKLGAASATVNGAKNGEVSPISGRKDQGVTMTSEDGALEPHQDEMKLTDERSEASIQQTQQVLPVIDPRAEPRRSLFSDPPLVTVAEVKKKKRAELKRCIEPRPMCYRVGALTVHSLGHVFVGNPSFHTRTAIYPLGFRSSRIFWSTVHLETRCLYECVISSTEIEKRHRKLEKKIEESDDDESSDHKQQRPRVVFKIIASDDQDRPIVAFSPDDALIELRSRVVSLYEEQRGFSGTSRHMNQTAMEETEQNPFLKRSTWLSLTLSGDYFFGFGMTEISHHIEKLPYAATCAVSRRAIVWKLRQQQQRQGQSPLASSAAATWSSGSLKRSRETIELGTAVASEADSASVQDMEEEKRYEFTQELPSAEDFRAAERVMEQLVRAEQRAQQSSGCARTDGFEGNRLFGTPKKRVKTMPRRQVLNKEATNEPVPGSSSSGIAGSTTTAMDIEHLPITMQYRELRRRPFDERMLVHKSSIHGYGLFLKEPVSEGQMIVEYQGQIIDQSVADERERRYEEQGVGSCYMFRLDENTIIDATRCGNLARFINHSCDPKAFARIVAVEGGDKKIVIFAKRAIAAGDEVTYDYKFPIEDEAIRCDCNASNCIGRMN